jgi:hypothetical protein
MVGRDLIQAIVVLSVILGFWRLGNNHCLIVSR